MPEVIYTIPPSSRLYYVTFVRIYDSTPDVVYGCQPLHEGRDPGIAGPAPHGRTAVPAEREEDRVAEQGAHATRGGRGWKADEAEVHDHAGQDERPVVLDCRADEHCERTEADEELLHRFILARARRSGRMGSARAEAHFRAGIVGCAADRRNRRMRPLTVGWMTASAATARAVLFDGAALIQATVEAAAAMHAFQQASKSSAYCLRHSSGA